MENDDILMETGEMPELEEGMETVELELDKIETAGGDITAIGTVVGATEEVAEMLDTEMITTGMIDTGRIDTGMIDTGMIDTGMGGKYADDGFAGFDVSADIANDATVSTSNRLMSSPVFIGGTGLLALVLGIVFGLLLAKKKIKKGMDSYED